MASKDLDRIKAAILVGDAFEQVESYFHEAGLTTTPIREIGLTIAGSRLEAVWGRFEAELERTGIRRLRPQPYLSTEWGVPFNTIAIAIPFYLAWPNLTALHSDRVGYVEGVNDSDILRYLRHEMGHVVNYAYRLYETDEWIALFGPITRPYKEDYRAVPFDPRYVRHLPGWYAQKHPDEDWAETFAVWMTPETDWPARYAGWPVALRKLEYCARTVQAIGDRPPVVSALDLDEDVGDLQYSLDHYYQELTEEKLTHHPRLDPYLCDVFRTFSEIEVAATTSPPRPASALLRLLERSLMADVYRWTGHFPERTRALLRYLEQRADELKILYAANQECEVVVALTVFVTALAMNYIRQGSYLPQGEAGDENQEAATR